MYNMYLDSANNYSLTKKHITMYEIESNDAYEAMYRAYANNNPGSEINKLEGQVRSAIGAGGFEKGDVIMWPNVLKFLSVPVRKGSTNKTQGLIVKVKPVSGPERYQFFYVNSLTKSIREIEVDDQNKYVRDKTYVQPKGVAAKEMQEMANLDLDESFRKIVAKGDIVISNVESVHTFKFGTEEVTTARLYTFDYAK